MNTSFTPGQWERPNSAPYSIWCGPTQISATRWTYDNGAVSAECEQNEATAQANARLIAASPELYAALWEFLEIDANPSIHGAMPVALRGFRDKARAALAKVQA
jgi:hypothetical protein